MTVSSLAACALIVLHNVHDVRSRAFVSEIPKDSGVCVVDWYGDADARFAYEGPPPSAFPSVVKKLPNGRFALARTPKNLAAVEKLDTSGAGVNTFESVAPAGRYIGGLQIWEAANLVKWGYPTDAEEHAILASLRRVGQPISSVELARARKQRPEFRKTPGLVDCQNAAAAALDSWTRTAQTASCLLESANTQFTQLLVGNVASREPERFVRELAEVTQKKELGDYLQKMLSTQKFDGQKPVPTRP